MCLNTQPIQDFLEKEAGPGEMAGILGGIETWYISYLLRHVEDGIPDNADSQVYYLRALKEVFEKMARPPACDAGKSRF